MKQFGEYSQMVTLSSGEEVKLSCSYVVEHGEITLYDKETDIEREEFSNDQWSEIESKFDSQSFMDGVTYRAQYDMI